MNEFPGMVLKDSFVHRLHIGKALGVGAADDDGEHGLPGGVGIIAFSQVVKVRFEPGDCFPEAVFQGGAGGETDGVAGAADIEAAAGLAVGFGGVPDDLAFEPAEAGDEFGQILDGDLAAAAEIHRFGRIVFFHREDESFGAVFDVEEFAADGAGAPGGDLCSAGESGLDAFADQGGDDVAGMRMEIIARAVEIDRQKIDGVQAVLLAVGLAHDQEGFFGDAVGGVGFLGVSVPEFGFAEGDGSEFGIGADGPDLHEFLDFVDAGVLDEVESHGEIGEKEPAGVVAIGADAADLGGEVQDDVGALIVIKPSDIGFASEIEILSARDEDVLVSAGARISTTNPPRNPAPPVTTMRSLGEILIKMLPDRRAFVRCLASFQSASVIIFARALNVILGYQPRTFLALAASPRSRSTSAGRK